MFFRKIRQTGIRNLWPREDFGSGQENMTTHGQSRHPQGVQVAAAHRMIAMFKLLKQFKVLENESILKNIPKNPFFSKKNLEKLNIFYKNCLLVTKNYVTNFNFYGVPY